MAATDRQFIMDLHFDFDSVVPEAARVRFVRELHGELDDVPMFTKEPGVFITWRAAVPGHTYLCTTTVSRTRVDEIVLATMTPRSTRLETRHGLTRQVRLRYVLTQNLLPDS